MELWGMGLAGWVIYNLFLLQSKAKAFDLNNDGLDKNEVGKYLQKSWPSIITTLAITITIVGFHLTEELFHAGLGWMGYEDQPFIRAFHLLPSLLSLVIQRGITKVSNTK